MYLSFEVALLDSKIKQNKNIHNIWELLQITETDYIITD